MNGGRKRSYQISKKIFLTDSSTKTSPNPEAVFLISQKCLPFHKQKVKKLNGNPLLFKLIPLNE